MNYVERYFTNPDYNIYVQIIVGAVIGIILSPWSFGLILFLLYIILFEMFYMYYVGTFESFDYIFGRAGVICGSILGWIIGRVAVGYSNPLNNERPPVASLPSGEKIYVTEDREGKRKKVIVTKENPFTFIPNINAGSALDK